MKKPYLILIFSLLLSGCITNTSNPSGNNSFSGSGSLTSENTTVSRNSATIETPSSESVSAKPSASQEIEKDPYENRTADQFYQNYTPAVSYQDSVYRTKHYFRSGDLGPLPYKPVHAEYQPKYGDTYIRNIDYKYTDEGNGYRVYDSKGNYVKTIYKGGAYITADDVCAYVMAFGARPSNYLQKKGGVYPAKEPWGKYTRLNFSAYSNNHSDEARLPTEDSLGNPYQYREMDIGGENYNTGKKITRDTYRLVFTFTVKGKHVEAVNERYVFLTADHYHSFYEYLNYKGGFGDKITPKTNYINTVRQGLVNQH